MTKFRRYIALFSCVLLSFMAATVSAAFADADIDARLREMAGKHKNGGVVLVLSGGGTRGFAHVGVLKVLEDMDIPIVGIVGTSIGSVIGGMYATGMSADEIREIIENTDIMRLLADAGTRMNADAGDHMPIGEASTLIRVERTKDFKPNGPLGLLSAQALVGFLNQHVGNVRVKSFMDLPIPFACIAADICTGEKVVLDDGALSSAIRASMSIPGLLTPMPLNGRLLVDGGIVSNLPVETAKELFPGYPVIAVNLTSASATRTPDSFGGFPDILLQMIDVMTKDDIKRNEELADLMVYPELSSYSMLDSGGYDDIYQKGFEAADGLRDKISALAASAPQHPRRSDSIIDVKYVRAFRVEGVNRPTAAEMEKHFGKRWLDKPYDAASVMEIAELLTKRDDIATIDVDLEPYGSGDDGIEIVFKASKRPPYEVMFDGYTTNVHSDRWLGATIVARDILADGDTMNLNLRYGNRQWGARLRHFTPSRGRFQWGFALSASREENEPYGEELTAIDRYSGRIMRYRDGDYARIGYGIAFEKTADTRDDSFEWGPYLYYSYDSLDNVAVPTKGIAFTTQLWWNTANVFVSHSNIAAYVPLIKNAQIKILGGLKTGLNRNSSYRALLGDHEELMTLARHPYAGDQAAWVGMSLQRDFQSSWWGALRGELFATYGFVMDDWSKTKDAWEAGVALSLPGQFFNGRVFAVYGQEDDFVVGFTIGNPRWRTGPLP